MKVGQENDDVMENQCCGSGPISTGSSVTLKIMDQKIILEILYFRQYYLRKKKQSCLGTKDPDPFFLPDPDPRDPKDRIRIRYTAAGKNSQLGCFRQKNGVDPKVTD